MRQTYLALWIQPLPEKVLDLAHFLPKVHRIYVCMYIYIYILYIYNYVYVYIYIYTYYIHIQYVEVS